MIVKHKSRICTARVADEAEAVMIGLMICIGIVVGLIMFDLAAWRWGVDSTESSAAQRPTRRRGNRDRR